MTRFAFVGLLVVACGSDPTPLADAAIPSVEGCAAIQQRWQAAVDSLDRGCQTEADCIVVGGTQCDGGETTIGECAGTPLNSDAYKAARAQLEEAAQGWESCTCGLVACAIDCQKGVPACQGGMCGVSRDACF